MPVPTITVELQKADGSWVEVSDYVDKRRGVTFGRGSGDEDGQPDAGSATITFQARDGRFTYLDPTYDCRMRQQIQITTTCNATEDVVWNDAAAWTDGADWPGPGSTVRRWIGRVESWPTTWDDPRGQLVSTTVTAIDDIAGAQQRPLQALVVETTLAKDPDLYWPLTDAEGATAAAEASGNGGVELTPSGIAFGSATGPVDGAGSAGVPAGGTLKATLPRGALTELAVSGFFAIDSLASDLLLAQFYGAGYYLRLELVSGKVAVTYETPDGARLVGSKTVSAQSVHYLGVWRDTLSGDIFLNVDGDPYAASIIPPSLPSLNEWRFFRLGYVANPSSFSVSHVALGLTGADLSQVWSEADGRPDQRAAWRAAQLWRYAYPGSTVTWGYAGRALTAQSPAEGTDSTWGAIQSVATADGGVAYVRPRPSGSKGPQLRYVAYADLVRTAADTSQTFAAEWIDGIPTIEVDTKDWVNEATGTSTASGTQQRYADAVSVAADGTLSDDLGELMISDVAVLARLQWKVAKGVPMPRVTSLSMDLLTATASVAAAMQGVDVGDAVRFTDLPDTAPMDPLELVVRGWTETISSDEWTIEMVTQPASDYQAWILGSAASGVLGSTTRLAY